RANTGNRHQASAHVIVPHDDQQAAVQDPDLRAQHPPDNEQRLNQNSQVGEVLDQLLDAGFELYCPDHLDLEAEVAQGAAQVIIDGNGLRLQQLAMGQQHAQFLAA